jgi:hypothetical protein
MSVNVIAVFNGDFGRLRFNYLPVVTFKIGGRILLMNTIFMGIAVAAEEVVVGIMLGLPIAGSSARGLLVDFWVVAKAVAKGNAFLEAMKKLTFGFKCFGRIKVEG